MVDFSVLNHKKVVFIGGGNMAGAIIDGLLKAKQSHHLSLKIGVSDFDEVKLAEFEQKGLEISTPPNAGELIAAADVVVLAVKPQVMASVCQDVAKHLDGQLVLSVAAGLSVVSLSQMLGGYLHIVRCMPNLPASVGLGASGLYSQTDDESKALAQAIMQASGITVWLSDESLMHAVTAVAGSAPAYFFYVLEGMIQKAVALGLDADDAKALAVQTMLGAAHLAQQGEPDVLRAQVTSKGGTTAAAIDSFTDAHLHQSIDDAMQACVDRSQELGNLLSNG